MAFTFNNYYAPISSYAPFKPSPLAKEIKLNNAAPGSPKTWKSRAPEKKPSSVNQALDTLFAGARYVRDDSIEVPRFLPHHAPLVRSRTNTHRGKNFSIFEGMPEIYDNNNLFLGVEVPTELTGEEKIRFCVSAVEYIAGRMKMVLEKTSARRVNASILTKKHSANAPVTIYAVVSFE